MRSSRLLCTGGESPSPLLHSLGFHQLRRGFLLLQTMVLADDGPRCSCILGYLQHSLVFRHLRSLRRLEWALLVQRRPKGVLLADYSSRQETHLARRLISPGDSSRQESHTSTQKSRQGSDSPPRKRRSGDSPHPTRVAKGVSHQGSDSPPRKRRSGDSPQRFSDYSSRHATLFGVSRTTRLAR